MRTMKGSNVTMRISGSLAGHKELLLPTQCLTDSLDRTPPHDKAAASPITAGAAVVLASQLCCSVGTLLAPLVPVAVLCAGIYVTSIEAGVGRVVDKQECGCDCWDGRFKGRHGAGGYKSMYFNLEAATAVLAAWTFVWVNALGSCMQRIYQLFLAGQLSYGALVPALLTFYPIFYGAWSIWNYINDRFYVMLQSQLFFQTTELVPAYCIYQLLDRQNYRDTQPLAPVLGLAVSIVHILLALKERVLWGLFLAGIHTVNARDVMLMAGDVSCVVFFGLLLHSLRLKRQQQLQLGLWAVSIVLGLLGIYLMAFGYEYQ